MIIRTIALALLCGLTASLHAQTPPPAATLFQNVRIFDGKSGRSRAVERAGPRQQDRAHLHGPIPTDRSASTVLIDGGGRTLMPGLIDAHWHAMLVRPTPAALLAGDVGYLNLVAGAEATDTLMRGFTTVRDMGGPAFGLKRAIDEGIVAGPRIYPVRRDDHRHQRSRRLPPAVRSAAHPRRPAVARGADRRQHDRRQSGRGPRARARAAHAGRLADQADGGRRRGVAAQPARRVDLHRARAARRRRSRRELGHLRHRARLHARCDPAGDRRRREVHRARPPDGRSDRQADGREGHLAEHSSRSPTKWPTRFRPARPSGRRRWR